MLYSMYKEIAPPTNIHLSITARLTDSTKLNLVCCKGNVLSIYRIYKTATVDKPWPTARLELIGEFTLFGNITSISAVRTQTSVGLQGLDSLLISFKDAKMSLVEYNVENQNIITVSMHNYEKEEFRQQFSTPKAEADPQSRCAMLHFYNSYFAILPFAEGETIPYQPSFVIGESEIDPRIKNVLDFKFLFGFLEPTVAILYEEKPTFAGRLAHSKDTCSLIVISLNLHHKTYPILYRVDGLPYNCTHIEPVPNPLGGVLIFSHNALIQVDQTLTPGLAAVVNPFFDMESRFKSSPSADGLPAAPIHNQPESVYVRYGKTCDCKDLGISLDSALSAFLSPDILLLVLRNGDMYRVDLVGDEGAGQSWKRKRGGVRNIKFKKLGLNMSPPSNLTSLSDLNEFMKPQTLGSLFTDQGLKYYSNFLFAASVVDDAMVIQYVEPLEQDIEVEPETVENDNWDDDIDMDLYGGATMKKPTLIVRDFPIKFRVCDTLLVTGAIRSLALGKPVGYSDSLYSGEPVGTHLEAVGCGGFDSHGSLIIFHRSIRPNIVNSFSIGRVDDLWAVGKENDYHKYLVVGQETLTKVLRTGEEIEELENTGFFVDGPTIAVGNCGELMVQVSQTEILLLSKDAELISRVNVANGNSSIEMASIQDPFAVVLMDDGLLRNFKFDGNKFHELDSIFGNHLCSYLYKDESVVPQLPTIQELKSKITEQSGKLSAKTNMVDDVDMKENINSIGPSKPPVVLMDDDLDEDLYGNEKDEAAEFVIAELQNSDSNPQDFDANTKRIVPAEYWLFAVDAKNDLRIFSYPSMKEKFKFTGFHVGHRFANDQRGDAGDSLGGFNQKIEEIMVCNLGADTFREKAYLFARNDKFDLLVYQIVPTLDYSVGIDPTRLAIQFVREYHDHISRDAQKYFDTSGDKLNPIAMGSVRKRHYMKLFEDIGSLSQQVYSGVALTGPRPCLVMMGKSGGKECGNFSILDGSEDVVLPSATVNSSNTIRIHPLHIDGPIEAFAAIHNPNIPNGFAYVNFDGSTRLAQLPSHFDFDHPWPICKVPLGRTAKRITYQPESRTYVLASSKSAVFQVDKARYNAAVAAGVIQDGDELTPEERKVSDIQDVIMDREPGMYLPEVDNCELELITPVTWESIHRVEMNETEQIICVADVNLMSKETLSGRKAFIAVGTGYMRSEELACRGRMLLYEIISVVPSAENPQKKHKLKHIFSTEEKQPVTAICAVNGYLLATIGTKIIMYEMENDELNGVAFLDVNIYVTSISAIKNFILISDVYRSTWFVAFQEDPPKLELLGKDLYPVHVVGSEFLVGESDLGMLVSDDHANLHVMAYEPYSVQSQGGQRLLRRGEINVGHEIQAFVPLRLRPSYSNGEYIASKLSGVISGTLDGGISMALPVSEKIYKRLYGLYSRMATQLEHLAGLNPRGYRQIKLPEKSVYSDSVLTGPPGPRGILDGDLLYHFNRLSSIYQRELAKAVGSDENRVMDDLLELSMLLEYF